METCIMLLITQFNKQLSSLKIKLWFLFALWVKDEQSSYESHTIQGLYYPQPILEQF